VPHPASNEAHGDWSIPAGRERVPVPAGGRVTAWLGSSIRVGTVGLR